MKKGDMPGWRTKVRGLPENEREIGRARLRQGELMDILRIYAANEALRKACSDEGMERRLRLIPGAWRDIRMMTTKLGKICDGLAATVPEEKRIGFVRAAQRSTYCVMQGPLASRPKPNEEEIITTGELDTLVSAAYEGRCRLCIEGNCDGCALGRVLDGIVSVDRNGRSWSMIDIERRG